MNSEVGKTARLTTCGKRATVIRLIKRGIQEGAFEMRRLRIFALLPALAAVLLSPVPAQAVWYPNSMASTGDSITRAFDATWFGCFLTDCPQYSWSTGTSSTVNSQYLRLTVLNPELKGNVYNDAKVGAKMADLYGQLNTAAAQHVDYVTVLIGGNDVCTSSVSTMTATSDFQSQFASALANFFALDREARVYVSSLPNVNQLYNLLNSNSSALAIWKSFNICQSALPPGGNDTTRQQVAAQEVADDGALRTVCGGYANCRYDGGAGYNFQFTTLDVSAIDYFHPSVTGQKDIAAYTWKYSYWGFRKARGVPPFAGG
jgi:lysophospholipase L1-like esterase